MGKATMIPFGLDVPCDMAFCSSPAKYAITTEGGHPSLYFKICEGCTRELVAYIKVRWPDEHKAKIDLEDTPKVLKLIDIAELPAELVKGLVGDVAIPEGAKIGITLWGPSMAEQLQTTTVGAQTDEDDTQDEGKGEEKTEAAEPKPPEIPQVVVKPPIPTKPKKEKKTYACKKCGRDDFRSGAALGAHVRRCKDKQ